MIGTILYSVNNNVYILNEHTEKIDIIKCNYFNKIKYSNKVIYYNNQIVSIKNDNVNDNNFFLLLNYIDNITCLS